MNLRKQSCHKNRTLLHCSSFIIHCSKAVGFTLIELLVVISIIGVLSSLVIVNVMGVRERVRDTQRKSDLNQIKKALFLYKNDYGNLFPSSQDNLIKACEPAASINWGNTFKCGNMVYMKILPDDPLSSQDKHYQYQQLDEGGDFCLWATLENVSDPEIANSKKKCSDCAVEANDLVVCGD